jgi:hypothetical protein
MIEGMLFDEEIDDFLRQSGFTEPSLEAIRGGYPRIRRYLESLGVTRIAPLLAPAGAADDRAASLLCLLAKQAMDDDRRNKASEHHLRNLTGIRPYKP